MSLDGFIAGPNDDIRQLFKWFSSGDTAFPVPGTDMVFQTFLRREQPGAGAVALQFTLGYRLNA